LFHVPRRAGNHPRLTFGLLAVLAALAAGGVGWATLNRPPAEGEAVEATLPPRPPLVTVEALPQLKDQLDRWGGAGRFTGGILVARGDEVLFRRVYGMADQRTGTPLELNSRFRLASVSKQFTAAAILRLQDVGQSSIQRQTGSSTESTPSSCRRRTAAAVNCLLTDASRKREFSSSGVPVRRSAMP